MNKAYILDTFANVLLLLSIIATAGLFISAILSNGSDRGILWVWGACTFVGGLLQYATFGGAAEIIKRLTSIDETLKSELEDSRPSYSNFSTPVPETRGDQTSTPGLGRSFRQ